MRVGLVLDEFDPRRGGVEEWTRQFTAWLANAGHEVHVVARRFGDPADLPPIAAHPIPAGRSRLDFAAAAEQKLRALNLDVIHDTGAGWHADLFQPHGGSRRASFEANLKLLPPWLRGAKRRLARWAPRYREFDQLARRQYADDGRLIVALSRRVADDFSRYHGVAPERVRLVYNGVDAERFTPDLRPRHRTAVRQRLGVGDDPLLLIVAHNFRLKGVPTLVRAVARLKSEGHGARLAVAGGKHLAPYRRMAARLGAADRVNFLGPVDDPAPYYAAADVYVQPTFYDPCSLVVLEALASGLPVVTSRVNGAGELLTPGREGFLIDDPADDAELAAILRPLLDAPRRDMMGHAARALALQHPFERNCRQMLALYEEILKRRRRAA